MRSRKYNLFCLLALFLFVLPLDSCAQSVRKSRKNSEIILVETPKVPQGTDEQILLHKGFAVSYNKSMRLPNWVAYELTEAEVDGQVPRARHFDIDPTVRGVQATNDDYRNSGWDKGHLVPAGDMKWDSLAMRESFYFSNVCPQNHNLNGGDWRSLEELCRDYARRYGSVWIAAGPIVMDNVYGRIGYNNVVVPDAFFKVLMVKTDGRFEGVGFVFRNEAGHRKLIAYAMSIDEVEEMTGIDFFYTLPDSVENKIEKGYSPGIWFLGE